MNIPVKYGLILGVIVGLMGFALATTGLHTNAMAPTGFVAVAIVINIVIVVLALRQTAPYSNWVGQILNGLVLGVVGAAIIFLSSWAMVTGTPVSSAFSGALGTVITSVVVAAITGFFKRGRGRRWLR